MAQVLGRDLRSGDTIAVWWKGNRDTITALTVYRGPLAHLFRDGASLADFALLSTGMTIDHGQHYEVVNRSI